MDSFRNFTNIPPIRPLFHQPPSSNPDNGFAILAIAVLAFSATAFLLLTYYFVTTKCNLRRRWYVPPSHASNDRAPGHGEQVPVYPFYSRGIDEFLIQEAPVVVYIKNGQESSSFLKCVVCLNEFQENEMLRILPKCCHAFHVECIDVWLQSSSNCPLCRSTISCMNWYRFEKILASNQEELVVIEAMSDPSSSHSAGDLEQRMEDLKKSRSYHDISVIDGESSVPPVRRSLSMDYVGDARVHTSIREVTFHEFER